MRHNDTAIYCIVHYYPYSYQPLSQLRTYTCTSIQVFCLLPPLTFEPLFRCGHLYFHVLPAPRSGTGMLSLLASSLWRLVALINVSQSFRAIALCHSVTKIQSGETVYCNFVWLPFGIMEVEPIQMCNKKSSCSSCVYFFIILFHLRRSCRISLKSWACPSFPSTHRKADRSTWSLRLPGHTWILEVDIESIRLANCTV